MTKMSATVSEWYLKGIREGRAMLEKYPDIIPAEELAICNRTIRGFSASSPVGQMLRGERDFWIAQVQLCGK